MTVIDPTTGIRPDPTTPAADAWAAVRTRSRSMTEWTDKAMALAAQETGRKRPGAWTRWRGRRRAARAEALYAARAAQAFTTPAAQAAGVVGSGQATSAGRLRLVPPVAALGTAFVLQTIAMTDVVGGPLARAAARSDIPELAARPQLGYLAALFFGLAVASSAEGAAAYLMDLYDKHLMKRDSVWVLQLAMVGYVGLSGGVIHWWLTMRHLPPIVAWVLAGMSASALFLYSRGSRWRHRADMRAAGHLDPAMPRLPMAAKVFHPFRWIVTLYLVSWDSAATPAEARARYEKWSADRSAARLAARSRSAEISYDYRLPIGPMPAPAPVADEDDEVAGWSDPGSDHGPTAVADAGFLRRTYPDDPPGRNELYRLHGGNKERWTNALRAYAAGADQHPAT